MAVTVLASCSRVLGCRGRAISAGRRACASPVRAPPRISRSTAHARLLTSERFPSSPLLGGRDVRPRGALTDEQHMEEEAPAGADLQVSVIQEDVGHAPADESQRPDSSGQSLRLAVYCSSMLALGFSVNAVGPMLPTLATTVRVEPAGMGPVLSCIGAGGFVGAFLSEPLLNRFRIKTVMIGTLVTLASAWVLVPSTPSIYTLAAEYAAAGACYQLVSVAAHQAVQREYGASAGGPINLINGVFGAGSLLVPIIPLAVGAVVASPGGLETYPIVAAMCLSAAGAFASLGGVVAEPPRETAQSVASEARPKAEGRGDNTFVYCAMLFIACSVGAETTYGAWLYSYASQGPLALSAAAAAAVVSTFWVSFTAGRFLGVPLSARFNPRQILTWSVPLAIAAPAAVMAAPKSAAVLFAAAGASGLGLSTGFPNGVAMLAEYVAPSPQTQSKLQVAACTGSFIFPPLVPALASALPSVGLAAFLPMAALLALVDLGLVRLVTSLGQSRRVAVLGSSKVK